ncbi:MAG: hypothetical protein ACE5FQ_03985 [Thiogranum sp.]
MTEPGDTMFGDSALVVAHPDDDILWLSSVIERMGSIIFCFNDYPPNPDIGVARKNTIAEYPLPNVSTLDIDEPESFDKADWKRPVTTGYGLRLSRDEAADSRYQQTFDRLVCRLKDKVADRKNVFTHNPWGEYGNEDHVLVYRALKTLQSEFHYDLWFSNCCSNRSVNLMNRYISGFEPDYICLPANIPLAREIADIYRKHGCWTWYEDYRWFEQECLMREAPSTDRPEALAYGHNFPVNYIKIHIESRTPEPEPDPFIKMARSLKRKLQKAL